MHAMTLLLASIIVVLPMRQDELSGRAARWRNLSEEQRQELRRRFEEWKKLPPEEQERIKQNLKRWRKCHSGKRDMIRRRWKEMDPAQRQAIEETARILKAYAESRSLPREFPRMMFVGWMRRTHAEELKGLPQMEAVTRDTMLSARLEEFRGAALLRWSEHVGRHGCNTAGDAEALRNLPLPEFWARFHELSRKCRPGRGEPPRRGH